MKLMHRLRCFSGSEEGQDLIEYALLVALIVVVAIGAVSALGNSYTGFWSYISGVVSAI